MEGYLMFRSLSRVTVVLAFVLALILSTVPAQAQPRDPGTSHLSLDTAWIDAALSWFQGLLGGGDSDSLQSTTTAGTSALPGYGTLSGSCIDPMGRPIVPCYDYPE
jgi:hypothetical protein